MRRTRLARIVGPARGEPLRGRWKVGRRRPVEQGETEVRARPLSVIGGIVSGRRRRRTGVPRLVAAMHVRLTGAVRRVMRCGGGTTAVRMVVAMGGEMRGGPELDGQHEQHEQHRRAVLAEIREPRTAVLHACYNNSAAPGS